MLTNVTHQMKIMREETFGPIMPVMAFDTVEEAIALANDSHYGMERSRTGPEAIRRFFRKKLLLTSRNDNPRGIHGQR
ncbi:MAG: aldehyde dehydrogenase family protein [Gammaproteobacteria bacterium PRO9]|nr:aldehyde dehydrogenase family protein [Gammaproteobacteria bacterium PRO9]